MTGRVLICAGSDSGGGAGIQADIKTVTMLGGFAMTAVTALTAQNTLGVFGIVEVDPAFIRQQMRVVLEDLGADAVKTGMLHSAAVIEAVAAELAERAAGLPLVVDPVMVAKGGAAVLQSDAVSALIRCMLPRATVLTPNLPEAEVLLGRRIADLDAMQEAATALRALGPRHVLLKGGHLEHDTLHDVLAGPDGLQVFSHTRIESRHTHGTGCTLASAIAAGLAQRLEVRAAVVRARDYVLAAIRSAPGLGRGNGPLDHGHPLRAPLQTS
jgi:hydroxymethylpyrimidine/phosphomethylpyrimidine kinase